jgi:hypothetical protein
VSDVTRRAAIGTRGALALLVLAVVTFLVVDVIEGPVFSLSTRTWPAEVRDGKVIAGIEGAVKAADRATGTVRIASGFLGLSSVRVVVTPQTEVAIHGKFGSLADLDRGQPLHPDSARRTSVPARPLLELFPPSATEAETLADFPLAAAAGANARRASPAPPPTCEAFYGFSEPPFGTSANDL